MDISVEDIVLPYKALSNLQLNAAVKQLNISNFRGCYCRDELPSKINEQECGILNLDSSNGQGTHWVAWYKDCNNNYYLDSCGLQPPLEIIKYLGRPIYYNTGQVQPRGTVVCGHLSLYLLKRLSMGDSFEKILNSLI
jgi:hypothetical protein